MRQSAFQGETIHVLIKGTLHSTFSAFQKIRLHAAQRSCMQLQEITKALVSYPMQCRRVVSK